MKDIIAAWDKADGRAIHPARGHSESEYWNSGIYQASELSRYMDIEGWAVDFGCGDGRVAVALHNMGQRVVGVDASSNMLAKLNKNCRIIPTVQSNGTDLDAALNTAGILQPLYIYSLAVLIHHDYESCRAILQGLAYALAPQGQLILDWPVSNQPKERQDWIDVTTWSIEAQDEIIASLGMKRINADLPWVVLGRR